jgi:hypothetical protein
MDRENWTQAWQDGAGGRVAGCDCQETVALRIGYSFILAFAESRIYSAAWFHRGVASKGAMAYSGRALPFT